MTAQIEDTGTGSLSATVSDNIAAEAGRRRMTQGKLAAGLGMSRQAVQARYTGRTPWTLDEVERAARFFTVRPADLLVRQQGLEPRTRWFSGERHLEVVA